MQVPLTVSFKGVPVSDGIRTACWNEAEKLGRYWDRITSCHVTVAPQQRRRKGDFFDIHVRLAVPASEIVVSHSTPQHQKGEKPQLAIRAAFDEARRQLQDHLRRLRGDTKHHSARERVPERAAAEGSEGEGPELDQPRTARPPGGKKRGRQ
ncbi:MAG TPA: HPF/RaiA family ribosome-associated protein [Planctomycetota bacterium]